MKNTKVFMFFFFLIFAVAFSFPAILMIPEIADGFNNKSIVKNGTETTATPVDYHSNMSVNDERIYYIEYEFEVDGVKHTGKTSTCYYLRQAQTIMKNGYIVIKYDKNFNSCEADYKMSESNRMTIVGCVVFTLADIGFWITEIVFIVQFVKFGIVSIKGKKYDAMFISINPSVVVNGTPLYKVAYTWTDADGEIHDNESGDYTFNEASVYENVKIFQILAFGNSSKIIDKPSRLIKRDLNNTEPEVSIDSYYECPYCGSIFNSDDVSRCHSCGAPVKTKKVKNVSKK